MPIETRSWRHCWCLGNSSLMRLTKEDLAMSFYLKRTYVDNEPNIELVNIYYTWTPMNTLPNWQAHSETRVMPRGGSLIRAWVERFWTSTGRASRPLRKKIELPDDGVRRKILSLPNDVHDPSTGRYNQHYLFHHYL